MNAIDRLSRMANHLRLVKLADQATAVESLVTDLKDEKPLGDAKPTGNPGTWSKPNGEIIKTSTDEPEDGIK